MMVSAIEKKIKHNNNNNKKKQIAHFWRELFYTDWSEGPKSE